MNSIGPNSANNGTNSNHVEERLLLLESEVKFWRRKFEELEKWRSCLDEWIQGTFGFNIRTNSHGSFPPGTTKGNNKISDSRFSSPHNSGWSPDSPDTVVRPSSGINLPENSAAKRDIDYVDAEDDEKFFSGKPGSAPKRKRGRPKKNALGGGASSGGGQDSSLDGSEIAPWENQSTGAGSQMKRGRGRPRKIRINSEELASDGGESSSKGSKKKPTTPTLKTCDVCMLECDSNQDLIAHKRAVHPERLYTCSICHETYLHPGFLARHMETHTMERNFRCQMCISSFSTYHLLKLHVAEKHGMDLNRQPDWKQNPTECRSMDSPDFSGTGISDRYNNAQQQQQQQHPNSLPMSPHSMVPPQQQSQPPSNMGNGSDYNNEALRASSHMDMPQMQQQQHNIMHQQMRHQHPGMMQHQQHLSQQMSSSQMISLQQHQSNAGAHHSMQQSHHDAMGQQQQQHHQQQQYHHPHHQIKDEVGDEVDSDGFPLDFDAPVTESLPSMFGNNSNGINAYNMNNMNSMGSDPLHMF